MALSDYGFVGNDIIPNTPIEKVITGYLLAINKVYRGVYQQDRSGIIDFLASINTRHFIINNSSYDYLRIAEQSMFYDSAYSQNNIFKRFCYLNGTTGEFILFNKTNTAAILLERNTIMQDVVAQLIDEGFQTSILPFYYYNNDYLTAVEFESFYRVFAYPFFKDYFIQRLKYLSLLRVYTEYRNYRWDGNFLTEAYNDYDYLNPSYTSFNDILTNIQYKYYPGSFNDDFLRLAKTVSGTAQVIRYYVLAIIKNVYVKKSFIDNFINTENDNFIYKINTLYEQLYSQPAQTLIDNKLIKLNTSTYYTLTYEVDGVQITDDFYKIDFPFNYNDMLNRCIDKVDNLPPTSQLTTCYWQWSLETYITTISDGFDFLDI